MKIVTLYGFHRPSGDGELEYIPVGAEIDLPETEALAMVNLSRARRADDGVGLSREPEAASGPISPPVSAAEPPPETPQASTPKTDKPKPAKSRARGKRKA